MLSLSLSLSLSAIRLPIFYQHSQKQMKNLFGMKFFISKVQIFFFQCLQDEIAHNLTEKNY
jgi:hypothetical protein